MFEHSAADGRVNHTSADAAATGAPTHTATPADVQARLAVRYPDLVERFEPDLVALYGGLLRHAVGPEVHRGVEPGYYATPSAASAAGWHGRQWTRHKVEALDDPRLADHRLLCRRGRCGAYELVPLRQIAAGFERVAAAPELARARARLLCERCDSRRVEGELCSEHIAQARHWAALAIRRRAQRRAEADERQRAVNKIKSEIVELLKAGDRFHTEAAQILETSAGLSNRAFKELIRDGVVMASLETRPGTRNQQRQRLYRLVDVVARPKLVVIEGGRR